MSKPEWTNNKWLEQFRTAYVTAMLWAETDDDGEPLDKRYTNTDLSVEACKTVSDDCFKFWHANLADIESEPERAGHDFWLTRNGHGAGFWDGDWPEAGDRLTAASKAFGECHPYVGDDGQIHLFIG